MPTVRKLAALAVAALVLAGCAPTLTPDESAWEACLEYNGGEEAADSCQVYLDRIGQDWFNARWNEGKLPPRECAMHEPTEACPPLPVD